MPEEPKRGHPYKKSAKWKVDQIEKDGRTNSRPNEAANRKVGETERWQNKESVEQKPSEIKNRQHEMFAKSKVGRTKN